MAGDSGSSKRPLEAKDGEGSQKKAKRQDTPGKASGSGENISPESFGDDYGYGHSQPRKMSGDYWRPGRTAGLTETRDSSGDETDLIFNNPRASLSESQLLSHASIEPQLTYLSHVLLNDENIVETGDSQTASQLESTVKAFEADLRQCHVPDLSDDPIRLSVLAGESSSQAIASESVRPGFTQKDGESSYGDIQQGEMKGDSQVRTNTSQVTELPSDSDEVNKPREYFETLNRQRQIEILIKDLINYPGHGHTNHTIRIFMKKNKIIEAEYSSYVLTTKFSSAEEKQRILTAIRLTYGNLKQTTIS